MSDKETLVVASKVKAYIKNTSGMNCSAGVIDTLSDRVRQLRDQAIESAKTGRRKTVQEKDVR